MIGALADLALRRPWALLAANLAVAAAAVAASLGAPSELGIGSTRLDGTAGPELAIVLEGDVAADTRVFEIAEDVITAQAETDTAVAAVRPAPQRAGAGGGADAGPEGSSVLIVEFEDVSEAERQRAVTRLEERIDPGPLRVSFGGETATLLEARRSLGGDLWRAELLVLPLVLLAMAAAIGPRLMLGPLLATVTAVAGTLAVMRLVGLAVDVSLLGLAPGAVVGAVLGIELPAMVAAMHRDEAVISPPAEALERAIGVGARRAATIAAATSLPALGMLATPLDQAPSLALGCALAAWLAAASALIGTPALIQILANRARGDAGAGDAEEEEGRAPGRVLEALTALPGAIASSRLRLCAALAVAAAPLAALTVAALDGESRPLTAADLPSGTVSRSAIEAGGSAAQGAGSLFAELPLATAVAAALLAAGTLLVTRRPGALLAVPGALLGAAAGLGACVLVFQEGNLAELLDIVPRDALDTGAIAAAVCALAALGAARAAAALGAIRAERRLGVAPDGAAELAGALTLPGTAMASVAGVALTGALLGVDLYAAKEFGFAVAVGLLADLVLIRVPLLAALARWGS